MNGRIASRPPRRPTVALLALLLAAGSALPASAAPSILEDPVFRAETHAGLDALYDMDFIRSTEVFERIAAQYPDHPVTPFVQALIPWWAIQLEPEDTSNDAAFLASMEEVIARCERRLKADREDVDAKFFLSAANAFRGRLHADRRHWVRAARDGQRALRSLREVAELQPENHDLYFGLGLFHYLADEVPHRYKVLRPFAALFPKGDRDLGLAQLERAMKNGLFVPAESAYALLQVHYVFEKDYKASLRYARWLRDHYPNNSLFHVYEGRVYERLGWIEDAKRVLVDVADRHARGLSGYSDAIGEEALYILARLEMRQQRYDTALQRIDRLEDLTRRRPLDTKYKALGRLRRGMALDALGQRQDAVRAYREVLSMKEFDEVRSQAQGYLRKPYGR